MVALGVYRYGASFVLKFLRESTFLRMGPSGPPLCTNGSDKYLMHLSVNRQNVLDCLSRNMQNIVLIKSLITTWPTKT